MSVTFVGEEATRLFALMSLRARVRLEAKGIKFRSSALKKSKQILGLPPRTSRATVLTLLNQLIENKAQALPPGSITENE